MNRLPGKRDVVSVSANGRAAMTRGCAKLLPVGARSSRTLMVWSAPENWASELLHSQGETRRHDVPWLACSATCFTTGYSRLLTRAGSKVTNLLTGMSR